MAVHGFALKSLHIGNLSVVGGVIMSVCNHYLVEIMECNLVCHRILDKDLQSVELERDSISSFTSTYLPLLVLLSYPNHIGIESYMLSQLEMVRILVEEIQHFLGCHIGHLILGDFKVRKPHDLLGQIGAVIESLNYALLGDI